MKKITLVGISLAAAVLMTGCGESDSKDSSSVSATAASITTKAEAENSVSAIRTLQTRGTSAYSSANSNSSYTAPVNYAPSLVTINNTSNCSNGGTMKMSSDFDTSETDITFTFDNCKGAGGETTNGVMKMLTNDDGENANVQLIMNNFKTQSSQNSTTMNMTMDVKTMYSNSEYLDLTMDGTLIYEVVDPAEKETLGYDNFRMQAKTGNYLEIDGKVSVTSTTNTCANGSYTLDTLEDLHTTTGGFDDGKLQVNGVIFDFNTDGTATVTFADGTTSIIEQKDTVTCSN